MWSLFKVKPSNVPYNTQFLLPRNQIRGTSNFFHFLAFRNHCGMSQRENMAMVKTENVDYLSSWASYSKTKPSFGILILSTLLIRRRRGDGHEWAQAIVQLFVQPFEQGIVKLKEYIQMLALKSNEKEIFNLLWLDVQLCPTSCPFKGDRSIYKRKYSFFYL